MDCPNCNKNLKIVSVRSEYETALKVDQCPHCGGIWFDDWELYSVDDEAIKKIDKVNKEKLQSFAVLLKEKLNCPKCGLLLNKLKDPMIPPDIEIMMCLKCNGVWMKRGETTEYKEYQERKKKKELTEKDKEFLENVEKLLSLHKSSDLPAKIGKVLSTRLAPGSSLTNLEPLPGYESEEFEKTKKIIEIIAQVATILLRLLIRR